MFKQLMLVRYGDAVKRFASRHEKDFDPIIVADLKQAAEILHGSEITVAERKALVARLDLHIDSIGMLTGHPRISIASWRWTVASLMVNLLGGK